MGIYTELPLTHKPYMCVIQTWQCVCVCGVQSKCNCWQVHFVTVKLTNKERQTLYQSGKEIGDMKCHYNIIAKKQQS